MPTKSTDKEPEPRDEPKAETRTKYNQPPITSEDVDVIDPTYPEPQPPITSADVDLEFP